MTISILLDHFETKYYTKRKRGSNMNEYIRSKHIITEIVVAIFVGIGRGESIHKNRLSHGLALNCGETKDYLFDNGVVHTVKKNDIIYLPKGSNYEVRSQASGNVYCINFQCLDDKYFEPFVFHLPTVDSILKAYQNAENAWTSAKEEREYRVISELYKILYELQRIEFAPYLPQIKRAMLEPAIDYIHKHYTEEIINIQHLSNLCGISYNYLRQLFEMFYGLSPIKYINTLKLKRAKELLSLGLYTVNEAALLSGFSDPSHFSRFFKKNVGVSPSDFIK